MRLGLRRGGVGWVAAARVWVALLGFGLAVGCAGAALGQTGTDGAIGGKVLNATGAPVAGALVVVHGIETELTMQVRSGTKGEFLVVRLPVGAYFVTAEAAGLAMALPEPVVVRAGRGDGGRSAGSAQRDGAGQRGGRCQRWVGADWNRFRAKGTDRATCKWRRLEIARAGDIGSE